MNKIYFIFIALFITAFNSHIYAQNEKDAIIKNTEILFGKSIDATKNVFKVNNDYNLHLIFQNEILIEAFILQKDQIPTKYAQNKLKPELKDNSISDIMFINENKDYEFLNENEFDDILSKLNSIKPKGKLTYQNDVSFALYDKTFWYKEYENATVRFHKYVSETENQKDRCITDIRIYFPETVTGKVISKVKEDFTKSYEIGVKLTDDDWRSLYRVTKETYDSLKLNKSQTFKGIKAGGTPIYTTEEN